MRNIEELFADYSAHHRTRGNKTCHRIGIPMIMFSLFGMLALLVFTREPVRIDAAIALIVIAEIFYFALSPRLALLMLPPVVAMYLVSLMVPLPVHIALFVIGWIFQFYGHSHYEKNRPAFAQNVVHLLVGPLWIVEGFLPQRLRATP